MASKLQVVCYYLCGMLHFFQLHVLLVDSCCSTDLGCMHREHNNCRLFLRQSLGKLPRSGMFLIFQLLFIVIMMTITSGLA